MPLNMTISTILISICILLYINTTKIAEFFSFSFKVRRSMMHTCLLIRKLCVSKRERESEGESYVWERERERERERESEKVMCE